MSLSSLTPEGVNAILFKQQFPSRCVVAQLETQLVIRFKKMKLGKGVPSPALIRDSLGSQQAVCILYLPVFSLEGKWRVLMRRE